MVFSGLFKNQNEEDAQFNEAFILALVHRLRTPLSGARWALDTFMSGKDTDDNRKVLIQSHDKIVEAINMVGQILKISEINSKEGAVELNKSKVDLDEIVDSILSDLDYLIKKKDINLIYNRSSEPIYILADTVVLNIGLMNLFDNAFRYSPKGNVRIEIIRDDGSAKLTITDDGIGIDPEDQKHIFKKFFRGKNARIIDPNQSGVGLYATKKIVEAHGGTISLKSELDNGTKIQVTLPVDEK